MPAMNKWPGSSFDPRSRDQRGFTIIEMMTAILILAILVAIAVPSFRSIIQNNSIVANHNELVASLSYARSEAIKRVTSVTVCSSTNNTSCAASNNWSTGWIVFNDPNANATVDAGETVIEAKGGAIGGVTLNGVAGLNSVRFTGTGMIGTAAGTFRVQKSGCSGNNAREIAIAVTGRVSTTRVACT
jgi:type IV fimbrial biogenesis protein FimT